MKKRFTFKCWNCPRTYTLFREITKEQIITVACPYCNVEAVVDLEPFRRERKNVLRRANDDEEQSIGEELDLPEVILTQKPG